MVRNAFLGIIRNIELCRETQNSIDTVYDDFCVKLFKEMNENIPSFDCSKKTRKRYKTFKPYWNEILENLWLEVRRKENAFTKFHGDRRTKNRLQYEFKLARNTFDKQLRPAERNYRRSLSIDIESVCTDNPKACWDYIKHLGPKRKSVVKMEVYDDSENIITDESFVFQKWSSEFENLYNLIGNNETFDNQFYEQILRNKSFLEDRMQDPLYEDNSILNTSILRSEVEKAVYSTKNGKSTGFDKIPSEVLKFPIIIDILHSLFNLCFDTGILPSIWRKAMITPVPKAATKDKRVPLQL